MVLEGTLESCSCSLPPRNPPKVGATGVGGGAAGGQGGGRRGGGGGVVNKCVYREGGAGVEASRYKKHEFIPDRNQHGHHGFPI